MHEILNLLYSVPERRITRRIEFILDFAFVGSIASFCFESFYFDYRLIDIKDYEAMYRFVISGNFIVPLAIFYIIWHVTKFFGVLLFQVPNHLLSEKIKRSIFKFIVRKRAGKNASELSTEDLEESSKKMNQIRPSHELLKQSWTEKQKVEREFNLLIRGLLACSIYFFQVEYFGGLLFSLIVLTILSSGFVLVAKYQMAEIFPFAVSVFEKYYATTEVNSKAIEGH
jgi:hypothetical protein